ncbi:hypothetical protein BCR33DRAFT_726286, partial [Rhizoclosmatium globosum]
LLYSRFIIVHEVIGRNKELNWKNIMTPVNVPLLLGTISLCGAYTARGINSSKSLDIPWGYLFTFEQFFFATGELCYLRYSFKRSASLIRTVFSPSLQKGMGYMMALSPILVYFPLIPAVWRAFGPDTSEGSIISNTLNFVGQILAGASICILDALFIVAFLRSLARTHLKGENPNPEFHIIATYGMFACICCFASLALYISGILSEEIEIRAILELVAHITLDFVLLLMFLMKIAILRVKGNVSGLSTEGTIAKSIGSARSVVSSIKSAWRKPSISPDSGTKLKSVISTVPRNPNSFS